VELLIVDAILQAAIPVATQMYIVVFVDVLGNLGTVGIEMLLANPGILHVKLSS